MQTIITGLALVALFFTSPCYGQTASIKRERVIQESPAGIRTTNNQDSSRGSGAALMNNVNIKAVRDFMKSFEKATDVVWTIVPDGFLVHCYCEGVQTRIYYDKKGTRTFVVRSFGENKLPHEIRHLVKSRYYDYTIFSVNEVSTGDQTVYLIKIVNDVEWKTLKIEDDEIYITEEYRKG